jgi:hypothetical protein
MRELSFREEGGWTASMFTEPLTVALFAAPVTACASTGSPAAGSARSTGLGVAEAP